MPLKTIMSFDVPYLQVMDERGIVDKKLMPKVSDAEVVKWYQAMVLSRRFSDKVVSLQRQGRVGTFAPVNGQEAAQVASAAALRQDDWVFPTFREVAVNVFRGNNLVPILLYTMGSEEGNRLPKDAKFKNFPIAIPIAGQYPTAVGRAWAAKIKKEDTVVVVYGGDGSTSEGDFHESCNWAGVFKTPCIFFIQNNQWAISVPRKQQSRSETIAQKAIAYGFNGVQVDGNDVFAVYKATKEAVDKARRGEGPTLIEAITYRMSMHTTADDPKVYRTEKEVEEWQKKDPILRVRKYLEKHKQWNEKKEKQFLEECDKQIQEAVKSAEQQLKKDPKEMFKYTFAQMPQHLKEEMDEVGQR